MLSSQLRYSLYGSLVSLSLLSLTVSAATDDGVFGDYFRNIITTPCATGYVITGYSDTNDANYGKKICKSIESLLATIPTATNVGIGTTNPTAKLDVIGGDAKINGVTIGKGASNISGNTAFGASTLYNNTTGNYNVTVGMNTLYNNTQGYGNTALGTNALFSNTVGYNNTALGMDALYSNTQGYSNTAIGYGAGSGRSVGSYNIAIGYGAQFPGAWNSSNQLNIGNWIYGSGGNIGIGTSTPTAKLEVAGQLKITGGTPGVGKVLMSDASGLASWQIPTGGVTGGQVNYVARWLSTMTLGTGSLYDNGTNIGIGTTTPTTKLEVAGQIKITGGTPGTGKVLTSDADGLASWQTAGSTSPSGIVTGPLIWSAEYNTDTQINAWDVCISLAPSGQWRVPSPGDIEMGRRQNSTLFTGSKFYWSSSPSSRGFWTWYPAYNFSYDCDGAVGGQCDDHYGGLLYGAKAFRCVTGS